MRPQIIIGAVIAAVIVAAGFVAIPRLFPAASEAARQASEQAELARRELHRYAESYALPHLKRQADLDALKEANLDQLTEQSQETLNELSQGFAKTISQAQQNDRELGREATDLRALRATPGDVRSAVGGFEQVYGRHQALFQRAAQHAGEALQADPQALGVAHIQGIAEFLRASRLLEEAQVLRRELHEQQNRLLSLATDWKLTQAEADHYAGLDVSEILDGLQQDLADLTRLREEAAAQVESLRQVVNERTAALQHVRAQLEEGRAALLTLEEKGFAAGDDASFNAYRQRYREIAEQLRGLQEEEQLLAKGGTRGGELVGEDPQTGELHGGEAVEGLEEFERKLVVAEESARRYADGEQVLKTRIEHVKESGEIAQKEQARYASRLEELTPLLDEARAKASEKHKAANAKEDEALQAAQAAVRAFRDSKSASAAWIQAASDVQHDKDPERRNERLKMIVSDQVVQQLTEGAQAAAKMLVARIHAQRVEATSAYLTALEGYAAVRPGEPIESAPLQDAIDTAREEAVKTLNECTQMYQKLVSGSTAWIPQSSLAVAYYMLYTLTVDVNQPLANEHMSNAIEAIRGAIRNEQWPFLDMQVRFREHLRAQGGQFGLEEEAPAEDAEPGEQPPEDGG